MKWFDKLFHRKRDKEPAQEKIELSEKVADLEPGFFCARRELTIRGISGEHAGTTWIKCRERITIGSKQGWMDEICITGSNDVADEHAELIYIEQGDLLISEWQIRCLGSSLKLDGRTLTQGETAVFTKPVMLELPGGNCLELTPLNALAKPDWHPPKLVLRGVSGVCAGKSYEVNKEHFRIGRDPRCDLAIASRFVARRHAQITYHYGEWLLCSFGVNGTKLEGRKLRNDECAALKNGAEICFPMDERFEVLLFDEAKKGA